MERQTIRIRDVSGQHIELAGPLHSYAAGTINYIEAEFCIAPHWRDCDKLYAAWYVGQRVAFTDIPESGVAVIPHELLDRPGVLEMNLVAENYDHPEAESRTVTARMTSFPIPVLKLKKTKK